MKKIISTIILLIVLINLTYAKTETRDGYGGINIEDSTGVIGVQLEITGLNPTKEYATININKLSRKINENIDIILITPANLSKVQAFSWKEVENTITTSFSYKCNGNFSISNNKFFCSESKLVYNNQTLQNDTFIIYFNVSISDNYFTDLNTIYWSTDKIETSINEKDITKNIKNKISSTIYGSYQFYIKNENFKKTSIEDMYMFKVTPSLNDLPIKYTICVGDADTQVFILCLDPTITNSRTWSVNNDFTNGTVLTNITTNASGIILTPGSSSVSLTPISHLTFNTNYVDSLGAYNATAGGSTVINTTFGKIGGGSAQLTAQADFINWATVPTNATKFAINCWAYFQDNTASQGFYGRWNAGANRVNGFMAISNNDGNMQVFTGDNINNGIGPVTSGWKPQNQIWNMFTFRYNGSKYSLYNNAILNLTDDTAVTPIDNTAIDFYLGARTGLGGPELVGKLDECSIFSGELTDADVTALYNSSSGRIYPWNNDGRTTGVYSDRQGWTPQTGNQISNISLTATNSSGGNIRFRSNSTNASLDTSEWTILANGTQTLQLNLGANNNIFYQFDFNGTGTGLISTYTINEGSVGASNTAPTVVITNNLISPIYTNQNATFNVTVTDAQETSFNITARWFLNGTLQFTETKRNVANNTISRFNLAPTNFSRKDLINVSVNATDGIDVSTNVYSATITINNTIPTISITNDLPTNLSHNQNATFNVTITDEDLDSLNVTARWFLNGTLQFTQNITSLSNGSIARFSLGAGNFSNGDRVNISANVTDGTEISSNVYSLNVVANNSAPSIAIITQPTQYQNFTSRNVTFIYNSTDADSDTINYYLFINNVLNVTETGFIGNTTINFTRDGTFNVTIRSYDSFTNSTDSTLVNFTIDSTAPSITSITDGTAPQNFDVDLLLSEIGNATLFWSTNSILSSNTLNYSSTFGTVHNFTIFNLQVTTVYYYQVNGTDRLGNAYNSAIRSITTQAGGSSGGAGGLYFSGGGGNEILSVPIILKNESSVSLDNFSLQNEKLQKTILFSSVFIAIILIFGTFVSNKK